MTTKKKVWFIADFFLEDVPQGGAELVNRQVVNFLKKDFDVSEIYSFKVSPSFLKTHERDFFILAGFINMPDISLNYLCDNVTYLLYEHDHKYVINRNPAEYKNFIIPSQQLVYQSVFKNALTVICQSALHEKIVKLNIPDVTTHNMGGSLWTEENLKSFYRLNQENFKRTKKNAIIKSDNPIKGQRQAEHYCKINNLDYDLISAPTSIELYRQLLHYEKLIYFPTSPETFSRVFMEAKLAGCKIVCNQLIGALSEDYYWDNTDTLFDEIRNKRQSIFDYFERTIIDNYPAETKTFFEVQPPKVSILTSVYKGQKHLPIFLEEISKQTCFPQCELILVDCNEGDTNDYSIISPYLEKFSNIKYHKLETDPGVYGAWNYAIENSTGEFLTNANLDDRRSYENIETLMNVLRSEPEIDLVYAPFIVTNTDNETFYTSASRKIYETHEFSPVMMIKCLPGCMPLWRRSLHDKNGLFDSSYTSAGDWEFWLRCVKNGSVFKRVNAIMGLYFFNPQGLSTSSDNHLIKIEEEKRVMGLYEEFLIDEKNNLI